MTRILVLGAGELGLSILTHLSSHPSQPSISVLLRPTSDPTSTRTTLLSTLTDLHVQIIYADLTQPDLFTHLIGFDVLISATGFSAGSGTQRHICQAALKANVGWFIPWQFGVDYDSIGRGSSQPLFDEQLDVRDLLRGQKSVRWTIISTGIFTSFLFDKAFGVVLKNKEEQKEGEGEEREGEGGKVVVNALGKWENRVTMTTPDDIGRLTAEIIYDQTSTGSGVEYIAGDTTTFTGIADALENAAWEVERRLISVDQLQRAREERPEDVGPKYQLIWARNVGVSWDVGDTWNARRGVEVVGMEEWIKGNFTP